MGKNQAPLFTFAIVSDTHVRPPGGDESSPFPVNLKANARARHAIQRIAADRPAFTIHLGDMVHPMPSLPTFQPAAAEAKRIFGPLLPDLHYVAGNHDAGDKPLKGLPAEFASEASLALYEKEFGPLWKTVRHGGCRFLLINSSLINRGLPAEASQWQWLETELATGRKERTFAFIHYPPFITTADEPSHYDNIDEPGRSRLLDLLTKAGVEAVFSGHVHHVFYNRLLGMSLYVLPPTSFIRQDYAEMFRVGPAPEYGRDDKGKYGYTLVDVHEQGHKVRIIPTDGIELGEAEAEVEEPASGATATGSVRDKDLVVHLRHDWATPIALPYNGPMEEFSRKRARNDGMLVRLWQMGLRRVRTPLADLLDPEIRPRIDDFHASGIRFTFFTLQVPDAQAMQCLASARHLTDALQIVTSKSDLSDIRDGLATMPELEGVPLVVGKLHSSADEPRHGSHFAHAVTFGFKWYERDEALAAWQACGAGERIAGLAFQINLGDDLGTRLDEMEGHAKSAGLRLTANVRLGDENPAASNFDDGLIQKRVETAVACAGRLEHVTIEIDTFMDVDRGYHPRHGLVDRLTNLRPAGRWLAGLS